MNENEIQSSKRMPPAELERIKQLPMKEFKIGGEIVKGLFDEESRKVYLFDENGKLSGKVASLRPKVQYTSGEEAKEKPKSSDSSKKSDGNESIVAKLHKLMGDTDYDPDKDDSIIGKAFNKRNKKSENEPPKKKVKRKVIEEEPDEEEPDEEEESDTAEDEEYVDETDSDSEDDEEYEETESDEEEDEEEDVEEEPPKKGKKKPAKKAKKKKEKKKHGFLVFLAVIAVAAVVVVFAMQNGLINIPRGNSSTGNNSDTTLPPVSTTTAAASGEEITVIGVNRDILAGEMITADDLRSTTIDGNTYNMMKLVTGGSQPYLWSEAANLVSGELYATEYISTDGYLTFDTVSNIKPVFPNTWTPEDDSYVYVTAPLDITVDGGTEITFGSYIDINITKYTATEEASGDENQEDVEGIVTGPGSIEASIVNRYSLYDILVCDVLNADGESLYETTTKLLSIPFARQQSYLKAMFETEENRTAMTPAYVRIRLTPAQSDALGDLTGSNMVIAIAPTGEVESSTAENYELAEKNLDLFSKIYSIIIDYQEQGAEDAENGTAETVNAEDESIENSNSESEGTESGNVEVS